MFGGVKCGDLTIPQSGRYANVSVVEGVGAVGEGVGSDDRFAGDDVVVSIFVNLPSVFD
jgi:hypothetical protein